MHEIKTLSFVAQHQPVKYQTKHVHYVDMQNAHRTIVVMDGNVGATCVIQPTHMPIGNLRPMRVAAKTACDNKKTDIKNRVKTRFIFGG